MVCDRARSCEFGGGEGMGMHECQAPPCVAMPRCWVGDREREEASFPLALSQSCPLSCRGKVGVVPDHRLGRDSTARERVEFPLGTEAPFSLQGESLRTALPDMTVQ